MVGSLCAPCLEGLRRAGFGRARLTASGAGDGDAAAAAADGSSAASGAGEYVCEGAAFAGRLVVTTLLLAQDGGASLKNTSHAGIGFASATEALGSWRLLGAGGVEVVLTRRQQESNYRGNRGISDQAAIDPPQKVTFEAMEGGHLKLVSLERAETSPLLQPPCAEGATYRNSGRAAPASLPVVAKTGGGGAVQLEL
eukprot:TRINITY_DN18111_c0_g1_i1.p1 TRINITY_DN18111_c0_g1~~TRINITY_DN18111_c0_g1_i1.p1  ORF type:complete len:220 (+),score=56.23 TRINITY_DN18111_c0_g1_i1:70-660(+)